MPCCTLSISRTYIAMSDYHVFLNITAKLIIAVLNYYTTVLRLIPVRSCSRVLTPSRVCALQLLVMMVKNILIRSALENSMPTDYSLQWLLAMAGIAFVNKATPNKKYLMVLTFTHVILLYNQFWATASIFLSEGSYHQTAMHFSSVSKFHTDIFKRSCQKHLF